jgi:hypothetical protein
VTDIGDPALPDRPAHTRPFAPVRVAIPLGIVLIAAIFLPALLLQTPAPETSRLAAPVASISSVRAHAQPVRALTPPARTTRRATRHGTAPSAAAAPPAVVTVSPHHAPAVRARAATHVTRVKPARTHVAYVAQPMRSAQATRGRGHAKHAPVAQEESAHAKKTPTTDRTKSNNGHHHEPRQAAKANGNGNANGHEDHPNNAKGKDKP